MSENIQEIYIQGLNYMLDKQGYNKETIPALIENSNNFITNDLKAIEVAEQISDYFALKGLQKQAKDDFDINYTNKQALEKIKEFEKDPTSNKKEEYIKEYAQMTQTNLIEFVKKYKEDFLNKYISATTTQDDLEKRISENNNNNNNNNNKESLDHIPEKYEIETNEDKYAKIPGSNIEEIKTENENYEKLVMPLDDIIDKKESYSEPTKPIEEIKKEDNSYFIDVENTPGIPVFDSETSEDYENKPLIDVPEIKSTKEKIKLDDKLDNFNLFEEKPIETIKKIDDLKTSEPLYKDLPENNINFEQTIKKDKKF